jgi:hypothetical protein
MDIGSLLLIIALFALVGSYIAFPLNKGEYIDIPQNEKNRILLESQQRAVLKSLVDLDFDLDIGKITADAHQLQRVGLLLRAETIYQKISALKPSKDTKNSHVFIEKQIKKYKKSLSRVINCTECGSPLFEKDKFCGECGQRNQQ